MLTAIACANECLLGSGGCKLSSLVTHLDCVERADGAIGIGSDSDIPCKDCIR